MKTFRQFCERNQGHFVPDSLLEAKITWDKNTDYWTHDHTIEGHDLQVHVERTPFEDKEGNDRIEHGISFTIGGRFSKRKISTEHGRKILHHVGNAIHQYLKKNIKPGDEVFMRSSDSDNSVAEKKNKIYGSFARKLADHLGGDYHHDKDLKSHHIFF